MKNIEDRTCYYKSAVAYCESGKEAIIFLGEEKGTISEDIKGVYGFGHDPIFIPEGYEQTYGETENVEEIKKFRRRALLQLVKYIKILACIVVF